MTYLKATIAMTFGVGPTERSFIDCNLFEVG